MPSSTNTFWIYTDVLGSGFAKTLQRGLQERVQNRVLRTRRWRAGAFVVTPSEMVQDKLLQLLWFEGAGVSCPRFTTHYGDIYSWNVKTVFARRELNGTQGSGIIPFETGLSEWPHAPLYVEYIPKDAEYRVHVMEGKVIDIQQKRKKRDFDPDERDVRIRNRNNGYVFCRGDIHPDDSIPPLAIAAVNSIGYAYGAVDIIWSKARSKAFVLEVNSKPGLEGTTLNKYVDSIIDRFNLMRVS